MARRGYKQESEFTEEVVDIRRVSKKTKGGDQIAFTALVVVGNKKGKVGTGLAKSKDVVTAIQKAIKRAHSDLAQVKTEKDTIAHEVKAKYSGAEVLIKPAPKGTGLIAGGTVRTVLNLAGVKNASAKMLGSNNKVSNVRCTIKALKKLRE
jgi:small subunit ribosomal protein S5